MAGIDELTPEELELSALSALRTVEDVQAALALGVTDMSFQIEDHAKAWQYIVERASVGRRATVGDVRTITGILLHDDIEDSETLFTHLSRLALGRSARTAALKHLLDNPDDKKVRTAIEHLTAELGGLLHASNKQHARYFDREGDERLAKVLDAALKKERGEEVVVGIPTGLPCFDDLGDHWRPGEVVAVQGTPNIGKDLRTDTPINTPTGWTTMGDLKVGDWVFDGMGVPTRVVGKTPVWKNRPIYAVRSNQDNEIIYAGDTHEWVVKERPNMKEKVITTEQLSKWKRRAVVAHPNSLDLPELDLPIDPYTLGMWLGDGTSASNQLTLNKKDADWIILRIEEAGYKVNPPQPSVSNNPNRQGTTSVTVSGLAPQLRGQGLLGNKHIPEAYLRASHAQRIALLQGLIDSDGYIGGMGAVEFSTKWEHLGLQVQELVRTLGVACSLTENRSTLYGKDCGPRYRTVFYHPEAASLPRKRELCRAQVKNDYHIEAEFYGYGDTVCIQVESPLHTFLAGKAMIPTHNSWFLAKCGAYAYMKHHKRVVFLSPESTIADVEARLEPIFARLMIEEGLLDTKDVLSNRDIRNLSINPDLYRRFHTVLAGFDRSDWITRDSGDAGIFTVPDIIAAAREYRPDMLIIDGFHLIRGSGKSWETMKEAAEALKGLAQDMGLVVLGGTQAQRDAVVAADDAPGMGQTAYGMALVEAANRVISLGPVSNRHDRRMFKVPKFRDGAKILERQYLQFDVDTGDIRQLEADTDFGSGLVTFG